MYKHNSFVTLTFSDEHLPEGGHVVKELLDTFIDSLRARLRRNFGIQVRYFGCGEYGTQFGRPHYHLLLFGYDFPDKLKFRKHCGVWYYISEMLQKLWPYGFSLIGDLTPGS